MPEFKAQGPGRGRPAKVVASSSADAASKYAEKRGLPLSAVKVTTPGGQVKTFA